MSDQIKKDLEKFMRDTLYGLPVYKPLYTSEFYMYDPHKIFTPTLEELGLEMITPNLNRDNFTFLKRNKPKETIRGQVKKGEDFYVSAGFNTSGTKYHAISVNNNMVAAEDSFGKLLVFEQQKCIQHRDVVEPLTPQQFPPGKVFLDEGKYYMVMSWPRPETCISADLYVKNEGGFTKVLGIEDDSSKFEFDANTPVTPFSIAHHIQD